jgi:hypothetical protein
LSQAFFIQKRSICQDRLGTKITQHQQHTTGFANQRYPPPPPSGAGDRDELALASSDRELGLLGPITQVLVGLGSTCCASFMKRDDPTLPQAFAQAAFAAGAPAVCLRWIRSYASLRPGEGAKYAPFHMKTIILPRQARDKRKENSKKRRFSKVPGLRHRTPSQSSSSWRR